MITIYHNPRCTKSREGLQEIENTNRPFIIRKYFDEPFTKAELVDVIRKLKIEPIQLVRTKEPAWIDHFKNKSLQNEEIIEALLANPKLIERPIIVLDEKAVIGRPKEKISEFLKNI